MVLDPKLREKVKDYISDEYNKGFTLNAIEKVLLDRGYKKQDITPIITEITVGHTDYRLKKGIPLIIISILSILFVLALLFWFAKLGITECDNEQCFFEMANQCKSVTYKIDEAGTVYNFESSKDCVFTKTITKVSDTEPQDIIDLFEGKALTCEYTKESFETKWVTTLLGGLDECNGALKEAFYELTIAQYREELGV
ncbi:hypothetical protein HOC35_06780 [Candidatus Woesearchaeota archaeon]|jgi:hypothetical protein|nr:hypothetical protein [Candidatus Woesearchaeota archaeon]